MKKYWFVLETYTFIWDDEENVLIYNSLSGKSLLFRKDAELTPVIEELKSQANLYVIELQEDVLNLKSVSNFVKKVRAAYSGDLYEQSKFPHKPIVIVPKINLNDEVERDRGDFKNVEFFGQKVLNNLLELSVFWGGNCKLKCKDCDSAFKQISWCTRFEAEINEAVLKCLIEQFQVAKIRRVTFIGDCLFNSSLFKQYRDDISSLSCVRNLMIHSRAFSFFDSSAVTSCISVFSELTILVDDIRDIKPGLLDGIREQPSVFVFRITSEADFEMALDCVNSLNLNAKFIPYYNGDNMKFFEDVVYQDKKTILSTKWSKKDIFSHQHVNANYFGNLTLKPDGDIFSDKEKSALGNILSAPLSTLVYKELQTKEHWRLTRDKVQPCAKCLYRYLCPPVSDYEKVIGKFNLCHL